jgi:C1A family cysteine protease
VVSFVSNQDLQAVMPNAPPGSGGGYFIVKNSWGSCFSDGGYIYLPWDYMKAEVGEAYGISGAN